MTSERSAATFPPGQQVEYHSYLLRVRRVKTGDTETRQAWLRDIPSQEEHYFRSLGELVAWLRTEGQSDSRKDEESTDDMRDVEQ